MTKNKRDAQDIKIEKDTPNNGKRIKTKKL